MKEALRKVSWWGVWAVLQALSLSAGAQPRQPTPQQLDLTSAIQIAVRKNPAVSAAQAQVDMSRQRVIQARAGFLPKVNISESYTRTDNPPQVFSTKLNQGVFSVEDFNISRLNNPDVTDNFATNFSGTWSVYDRGQTWYGWHQAKLGQQADIHLMQRTRQKVIADTVAAYLGLVLARQNLAVVRQALETARADLKMARSRYASGFAVKSDYLRAQVHIADLQQQELEAESQLEVARAMLNAAMGVDIDSRYEISDRLQSGKAPSRPLQQWLDTALCERPDYKQLDLQRQIAEKEISKSKAAHLPSLDLVGNYQINSEKFDDHADNYTIGAVLNLNLFSGYNLTAKQHEALAALARINALQRQLKQQILVETRRAYLQAHSSWKRIQVARASVAQAQEALRIVGNRYQTGIFTIVDLLNAELALQRARTNRLRSIHDYKVARARLALAAGTLDRHFK